MTSKTGAGLGERSPERLTRRNGYRDSTVGHPSGRAGSSERIAGSRRCQHGHLLPTPSLNHSHQGDAVGRKNPLDVEPRGPSIKAPVSGRHG